MNLRSRQSGFILMFTMMILAAGVALVGAVAMRVHNAIMEHRFLLARERAKIAALGGVELIRTRLTHKVDKKVDEALRLWLLTYNDVWQVFPVPGETADAKDTLYLRVACEDGKIDLNMFFNSAKKAFVFGGKDNLKNFGERVSSFVSSFAGKTDEDGFFGDVQKALKERKEPLVDLTEIFSLPPFQRSYISLFPSPPQAGEEGVLSSTSALSDLFVFSSGNSVGPYLQPQFFSRALQGVLELKPLPKQKDEREKWAKELLKKLTSDSIDWSVSWDGLLGQSYGVKLAVLQKKYSGITSFFSKAPRESLVSVISYGSIGGVTQGVYAILRPYLGRDNIKAYVVTRLYWI